MRREYIKKKNCFRNSMKPSAQFVKGTLILSLTSLLCRFLGFFYKIFLAQALGAEGMGIYQLIFPVFSVCHALTASGLETAVSRFTASRKEEGPAFLYAGVLLSLSASFLTGAALWLGADFISVRFLHEARCGPLLKILAAAIPLAAFHGCFAGYCLGCKKTGVPAAAQFMEQAVRIGTVWLLCGIFAQQGREITPSLAVFGLLSGEIASSLIMLTFAAPGRPAAGRIPGLIKKCRTLLSMAMPLTANRLTLALLQSLEAVLIPLCLRRSGLNTADALSLYGILTGMSMSFLMFPNALTSSVSSMLLPAVSEEQARGDRRSISRTIEYTLQFGLSIGIFCMGLFLRYGQRLGELFFQEPLAGRFLVTLAWICPFLYLTGNLNSILHGLGQTAVTFINQLIGSGVRILCILLLVPSMGIQGVLLGILASQLALSLLGILAVSRHVNPTIGLDVLVLKPLGAMLLSMGGVELANRLCPALRLGGELIALIFSIGMMAAAYFLLLLASGVWKASGGFGKVCGKRRC